MAPNMIRFQTLIYLVCAVLSGAAWPLCELHLSCGCNRFCSRWLTLCSLFLINSGFAPFILGRIAAVLLTFTCYARTLEWTFLNTWPLLCLQNCLEIRESAPWKVTLSRLLLSWWPARPLFTFFNLDTPTAVGFFVWHSLIISGWDALDPGLPWFRAAAW